MDLSTLMPQQLQVVKTLDRPLFVSAGAGSGKTFTLTRRIVYALSSESGPFVEHLDQVLAITFTKDAAAEIRDRVRRALIDEGMDEEALAVDDAWISTIHGMCSRILRAHALELGIDPSSRCSPIPTSSWIRLLSMCWVARRHPTPPPSSRHRSRPSMPGIPWRARAVPLAAVRPSRVWCATCWSCRASCRAVWTTCAWRAARPIPRTRRCLSRGAGCEQGLDREGAGGARCHRRVRGERQDHGRCGATHDVVHHAAREQGIP